MSKLPDVLPALFLLAQTSDREALTQGVGPLVAPGALPGAVVASRSAIVVMQSEGKPVIAAGPIGRGRVVVSGHGAFFAARSLDNPSNSKFLSNALAWLGRRPLSGVRVGTLGFDNFSGWAGRNGVTVIALKKDGLEGQLLGVDVLAMGQDALAGDARAQSTAVEWVKSGHGLLITGPAWGWQQLNPGKDLVRDLSANRMLIPYGLGLSGETAGGAPSPEGADDPLLQTRSALDALKRRGLDPKATGRASDTVARALGLEDPEGALAAEVGRMAKLPSRPNMPTKAYPITNEMPLLRLQAVIEDRAWRETAPERVKAAPSAADFPGLVDAAAKRVTRTVTVDTRVPQWHGTGLYAAPGEVVVVQTSAKGLGVRIGSHTDQLWGVDKWDRAPSISRRWELKEGETRVANPYGGTVFVDVPEGSTLGRVEVTIRGAVPAPRYVRGVTMAAEWNRQMAEPGGPWVELEGEKIALSIPRSACLDLKDPGPLMAFWDETFDRARELYAAPARPRPERYCVDRQISAGYMHSGYPIMTFEDVAKSFVDVAALRGKGKTWGFFHELGHNFQEGDWTFDGTGEVTNNLFSLYGSEKLDGITPAEYGIAHKAMAPEAQRKRLVAYLAKGAPFDAWKSDPFLALTMYAQVREAFGWAPFTQAFASYRTDRPRLRGEIEKHDAWMVRLSRATGRNLGPFFAAWGVPTSEPARASIATLPGWMPADWPS